MFRNNKETGYGLDYLAEALKDHPEEYIGCVNKIAASLVKIYPDVRPPRDPNPQHLEDASKHVESALERVLAEVGASRYSEAKISESQILRYRALTLESFAIADDVIVKGWFKCLNKHPYTSREFEYGRKIAILKLALDLSELCKKAAATVFGEISEECRVRNIRVAEVCEKLAKLAFEHAKDARSLAKSLSEQGRTQLVYERNVTKQALELLYGKFCKVILEFDQSGRRYSQSGSKEVIRQFALLGEVSYKHQKSRAKYLALNLEVSDINVGYDYADPSTILLDNFLKHTSKKLFAVEGNSLLLNAAEPDAVAEAEIDADEQNWINISILSCGYRFYNCSAHAYRFTYKLSYKIVDEWDVPKSERASKTA